MNYPIYEFGGQGPVIHLAIANGFPPQTYTPMLAPLTAHYRVVCLPPRPLWEPAPDPAAFRSWHVLADDMLAGMQEHGLTDVIALGHSMGGVASMLAAQRAPERFRALILLDPTIFPPRLLRGIRYLRALGLSNRFPLVKKSLKRRQQFASAEEAFQFFRARSLFRDWPDATLRLYAESMSRPNGQGVTLAYPATWEAQIYRTIFSETWRIAPKLRGRLPILAVRGTETDTFFAASASRLKRLLPNLKLVEIAGHGHLFPQSAAAETARIVRQWLAEAVVR